MAADLEATRALLTRGDYASLGDHWAAAGEQLAAEDGGAGLDVLEVAAGTGAVVIAAARSGGRVTPWT